VIWNLQVFNRILYRDKKVVSVFVRVFVRPSAIGTETYGSGTSAVCGATGLRPTFGSVARTGGMNLAWTSDRIGPIAAALKIVQWYSLPYMVAIHTIVLHELCLLTIRIRLNLKPKSGIC
jgi:hypothetical protein